MTWVKVSYIERLRGNTKDQVELRDRVLIFTSFRVRDIVSIDVEEGRAVEDGK